MRLFLLITLVLGYVSVFSQSFSKTGTDDLYLYKATLLYKDDSGFIADVRKNFDSISILPENGVVFLRVVRQSAQQSENNSGQHRTISDTILRRVSRFQIDTISYDKTKEYTKQGQNLKGSSLVYFFEQDDSLSKGETFYFNSYFVLVANSLAKKFGMPVLRINREFLFGDGLTDEEDEYEEEKSIIKTRVLNIPYKLIVPENFKLILSCL